MHRNQRIGLLILSLLMTAMTSGVAECADAKPEARGREVDYPLGLVAFVSVDRLRARAVSLGEALGDTDLGAKLLTEFAGDDTLAKLLNSPGLDTTRPIGAMCYPKWFGEGGEADSSEADQPGASNFTDDPFGYLFTKLQTVFFENATLAVCIPTRDREQLLATMREMFDDKELVKVETQPGWFQIGDDEDMRLGFVGNYLLLVVDDGEEKQFDRNYPEFDKLARSSLGKNGFVYSLYRRGLPAIVRDAMAPAFKMAFAARLQRQDDEPEIDFHLRTMFGSLQTELLDVALFHIEEFRISGHVDSATRTIMVEPELVGPKDGTFAKFCNSLNAKQSPFASISHEGSVLAASISLPLPAKQWKPVSDVLYEWAKSIIQPEAAELIRTLAKTIESGQLDLQVMTPDWEQGLLAVRVAGTAKLPEQLQQTLVKLYDPSPFQFSIDSVEGLPIHRSASPPMESLLQALSGLDSGTLKLSHPDEEVDVEFNTRHIEKAEDGTEKLVRQKLTMKTSAGENSIWIAATPQAVWVGLNANQTTEKCPEWFKSQVAASLVRPAGTVASNRSKSPFQLTLRGLGASSSNTDEDDPKPQILQVAGTDQQERDAQQAESEREQARGDILRDMPNAIRCELRPTETGLKLNISFEQAYFHWFAIMAKHSLENSQAVEESPPAAMEVEEAPDGK